MTSSYTPTLFYKDGEIEVASTPSEHWQYVYEGWVLGGPVDPDGGTNTQPPTTSWTVVEIRGKLVGSDGAPIVGTITFIARATRNKDLGALTEIITRPIVAQIAPDGTFSVWLPATDDPSIAVLNFTYQVIEDFVGGGGVTFDISVPISAEATGLEYSQLAPDGLVSAGTPSYVAEVLQARADTIAAAGDAADSVIIAQQAASDAQAAVAYGLDGLTVTAEDVPHESGVDVVKTGTSPDINLHFKVPTGPQGIQGIQGIQGPEGPAGRNVTSVTRTSGTGAPGTTDTYTIAFSDATSTTFDIYNGTDGTDGATGATGRGISTVVRTSGTGAPGTTDTYTITYSDATTSTFAVYNGANGTGTGDVVGPAAAVDSQVAAFDTASGKLLKDGGATVAQIRDRSTHTGTQSLDTTTDSATRVAMTPAERTKLGGVATGATVNATDAQLRDRSTHTGTQAASTITGLAMVATSGAYTDLSGKPTLGDAAAKNTGTTSGTVAAGDDSRITGAAQKTANLSDLANTTTARTNLGLGTAATKNTGTGAGQIPLLSGTPGTPDGTKFLRDDGTWAEAGGGGGGPLTNPVKYAPAVAVTKTTTSTTPVDVDATNLVTTFTAPASGRVAVILSASSKTTGGAFLSFWCLREGTTNVPGSEVQISEASSVTTRYVARIIVAGLTPGTPYTYKWAYRTQSGGTVGINAGAPEFSGTTLGPATMEVYAA